MQCETCKMEIISRKYKFISEDKLDKMVLLMNIITEQEQEIMKLTKQIKDLTASKWSTPMVAQGLATLSTGSAMQYQSQALDAQRYAVDEQRRNRDLALRNGGTES